MGGRAESARGRGGIGVQQLDIVVSSGDLVVADARGFLAAAAGAGTFMSSGVDLEVGEFYYHRTTGFLAYTRHRRQADRVGVMVTELGYAGMR